MKTYINGVLNATPQVGQWNTLDRVGVLTLRSNGRRTTKAGKQRRRYHARRISSSVAFKSGAAFNVSDIVITQDNAYYAGRTPVKSVVFMCDAFVKYTDESRL